MSNQNPRDVYGTWIAPRLYVGRAPERGPALYEAGFDLLVLCALPSDYRETYGESGQALYARFPGLYVIGCPIGDWRDVPPTRASVERARRVAREVSGSVHRGERVLLTCMEGRNRSAFVAALALHDLTGLSGRDCAERVRELRQAQIGQTVLFNPFFNAMLDGVRVRPSPIEATRRTRASSGAGAGDSAGDSAGGGS